MIWGYLHFRKPHQHLGHLSSAASTAARRRAKGRCTLTATRRPRQRPAKTALRLVLKLGGIKGKHEENM